MGGDEPRILLAWYAWFVTFIMLAGVGQWIAERRRK